MCFQCFSPAFAGTEEAGHHCWTSSSRAEGSKGYAASTAADPSCCRAASEAAAAGSCLERASILGTGSFLELGFLGTGLAFVAEQLVVASTFAAAIAGC